MPSLRLWSLAVAVPCTMVAANAFADDAVQTEREKTLEKRVEDLEKQIRAMNDRLSSDGASYAGDELSQRMAEIEKLTKKDADGLFAYWKNGIRLDSASGAFKLKIGGRVQNDWSWFAHTTKLEGLTGTQIEAGEEFRRARLYVGGTIYGNIDFMNEWDFAGGAPKAREVWIGTSACGTYLQVGSFKEPFGLEENTSDLFTTFIERSAGNEAFSPSYNTGIMASSTCCDERVYWAGGVFRDANDAGNDTGNDRSGEYNLTGRVAGRPWIGSSADQYLHVGGAASFRTPSSQTAGLSAHPELHLAPVLVGTGPITANHEQRYEGEAMFGWGQLNAQAEIFLAHVGANSGFRDLSAHAWATQASWFLTGESRPYDAKHAVPGRVTPKTNFDGKGGLGAWEVAARFDAIDLSNNGYDGGHMRILTAGVNWYLNPNTKVQLDWVYANLVTVSHLMGLEMRFQIDF